MDNSTHRPSRPSSGTNYACRIFECSSRFVLQIPPTPEHPGPAFQQNMPMYQRDEYPTFQNCHYTQCSAMRHAEAEPPNWYPIEQQDPSHSGVSGLWCQWHPTADRSLYEEWQYTTSERRSGCRQSCRNGNDRT